jgi:hypothetical protein
MKMLKKLFATFMAVIPGSPFLLMAQDEGTYIDNLGVQDSSYMEQDLLADTAGRSGTGTTIIIIIVLVVVIAAVVYSVMKKKKKK